MPKHQFPLYFHEIYSSGLDRTARFPVDRYKLLAKKLSESDEKKLFSWQTPRLAKKQEVLLVHDENFVERFFNHQLSEKEIRRIGLKPWKDAIVERTLRLTGGALQALEQVLVFGHTMAGNMAGGTHHAFRKEGAGYCIFNDLAICAEQALLNSAVEKILILDLDVHQGDGTAKIFEGDERVFTVSLHGKNNFPFRKQTSDWDVEFENDTGDEEYLTVLDEVLSKLSLQAFDLVFFQAGVDALDSDALGLLNLSREGLRKRNQRVFAWREQMELPMVIFMGGGYAKPIDDTVDAFTDLFLEAANRI
ncbi:MAG: histone deacetylase [Opitutae bacterium]|nr:histone deacetylase [Opitutae bacterium]